MEAAVTTASLAVEAGDSLHRLQRYVTDFQAEVSVPAANPAVAAFNDKVRDALTRLDEDHE